MSMFNHDERDEPSHGRVNRKYTRWDRIRKKYSVNDVLWVSSLKTDAVRRLIDTDFIGQKQRKLLNGESDIMTALSPQVVMDLRHQLFRENSRNLPLATVGNQQNVDRCVAHNIKVEQRYFKNKLNKFRIQLEKQHKRNEIKLSKVNELFDSDTSDEHRSESRPIQSVRATAMGINEVYTIPFKILSTDIGSRTTIDLNKEEGNGKENTTETNKFKLEDNDLNKEEVNTKENTTETNELKFEDNEEHSEDAEAMGLRCILVESDVKMLQNPFNTTDSTNFLDYDLAEGEILELPREQETLAENSLHYETKENIVENDESKEQMYKDENCACLEPIDTTVKLRTESLSTSDTFLKITQIKPPPKSPDINNGNNEVQLSATKSADAVNQEQNLIIGQLFQTVEDSNVDFLRKYFQKWAIYKTEEHKTQQNSTKTSERKSQINEFLDKIRKEKIRLNKNTNNIPDQDNADALKKPKDILNQMRLTNKYENKIKVQNNIIERQRLKLERQERMIMELKLERASQDAKEAREEMKEELKSIIRSVGPKTKAKAKCLIQNVKDADDESFTRVQGQPVYRSISKFSLNMQQRALQRSMKQEQARKRRQQHEAEREAEKLAAKEAKRLESEEAKRLRFEALKEKRRQEKLEKVIKEHERQRAIADIQKANNFCRRRLLMHGMEGFRRLVQLKYDNLLRCEVILRNMEQRRYFYAWQNFSTHINKQKVMKAKKLYDKILMRRTVAAWITYVKNEQSKMYVAIDWYELKLTDAMFVRWFGYYNRNKMIDDMKFYQATMHHEWHLKWKVFDRWQCLRQILQLEKETDERRQRWRTKIWELLPDYTPNCKSNKTQIEDFYF